MAPPCPAPPFPPFPPFAPLRPRCSITAVTTRVAAAGTVATIASSTAETAGTSPCSVTAEPAGASGSRPELEGARCRTQNSVVRNRSTLTGSTRSARRACARSHARGTVQAAAAIAAARPLRSRRRVVSTATATPIAGTAARTTFAAIADVEPGPVAAVATTASDRDVAIEDRSTDRRGSLQVQGAPCTYSSGGAGLRFAARLTRDGRTRVSRAAPRTAVAAGLARHGRLRARCAVTAEPTGAGKSPSPPMPPDPPLPPLPPDALVSSNVLVPAVITSVVLL